MKRVITATAAILFTMAGCTGNRQAADGIVTVDVTASYPKKELILQDFMDVEYIPLETNDEFVTQGQVMDIGRNLIAVKNYANDGDIFLFDRKTGKGLKKINRKGQGSEEYTLCLRLVLDEENNEMFVCDYPAKKMAVYSPDGNFKRSFKHRENIPYDRVYSFGPANLICHYDDIDGKNRQAFTVISKQDGSLAEEIRIPFEDKVLIMITGRLEARNMTWAAAPSSFYPIIPGFGSRAITETSSDTVYSYSPGRRMTPLIARTPPVRSMNPEVFLFLNMITARYYFMETVKKEYDIATNKGFPSAGLVYDRQEKALYSSVVYNGDYTVPKEVYMNSAPVSDEIATCQPLQAYALVEALGKGELKGRLKEIASTLDEDSNPVLMLIKHKK